MYLASCVSSGNVIKKISLEQKKKEKGKKMEKERKKNLQKTKKEK